MQPRKSLPKTALPRIYFIDREIAAGKYPNAPALAKEYETSLSTINRDIAYMRDMLGAPVAYDFFKKGFYYTEKTFRLAAAYATADDLLALSMAKDLMDLYRNTPIHEAALNLLENISAPLSDMGNTEWFRDRIVIPRIATASVDEGTWEGIIDGLKMNKIITFEYLGMGKGERNNHDKSPSPKVSMRRVRPYQLLFDMSAWYLSAFDEDKNDTRRFALSRISHVALTDKTFTMPVNFDYRRIEGLSYFGVYAGDETYRFVIVISGDTRWVRERVWAEDQSIMEKEDGIELSFTSNQLERVLAWVLSQTPNAKPLAPKALVERWREVIQEASKIAENGRFPDFF